jgi:hypothetical protein
MDSPRPHSIESGAFRPAAQDNAGRQTNVSALMNPSSVIDRYVARDGSSKRSFRRERGGSRTTSASADRRPGTGETIGRGVMGDGLEIDIDALLSESVPASYPPMDTASLLDRQIAREVAQSTRTTTLLIMGRLSGPRCMPARCERMGASFKLISMRNVGGSQIAMFSVPVESEMAELFEEIDGRRGLHAVAYDSRGRTKEAYVL